MAHEFRLPGASDRTAIIGRSGSGKTTAAKWLLSQQNWDKRPWIIIDYKRQDFDDIPGIQYMKLGAAPPRRAGIYIVQPMPFDKDDAAKVEELFLRIWDRGKIGLLIDEGYLTPNAKGFPMLLVTGRSKQIPLIINSQRPVWVPPYIWSESSFFFVFHLLRRKDELTVEEFTPFDLRDDLPPYHSRWYDVNRNSQGVLLPVPDSATVRAIFEARGAGHQRGFPLWSVFTSRGQSKTGSRLS